MKKYVNRLLCILLIILFSIPSTNLRAENSADCEDTIQSIISAMDNQDWNGYLKFLEEDTRNQMASYFDSLDAQTPGINQIIGAEIKTKYKLDFSDFEKYVSYDEYDVYDIVGSNNIYGYLLGINLEVEWETHYYYNGLNYKLWIMVYDGNDYKLTETMVPEYEIVKKYVVNKTSRTILTEEEQNAINASKLRGTGLIINNDGELILDYGSLAIITDEITRAASQTIVPSSIRVYWRSQVGGDNKVYDKPFRYLFSGTIQFKTNTIKIIGYIICFT